MADSELLADRLRNVLNEKRVDYLEKKMMGELCIMVDDKMCCGIVQEEKEMICKHFFNEKFEMGNYKCRRTWN